MESSKETLSNDNDIQKTIEKHDNPPKKKLSENAIFQIIGLTIPFLYLFGYLYYQGYFSAYGIDLGLFPQSADHYFVSLFLMISGPLLTNIEKLGWLFIIVIFYFVLVVGITYPLTTLLDKYITENKSKKSIKPNKALLETLNTLVKTSPILINSLMIIFIFLVLSLFGIASFVQGKDLASKQKNTFEGCEIKDLSTEKSCDFLMSNNQILHQGIVIANSETHYAIWDGKKTLVVPIKDLVLEVRYGEKEEDTNQN